MRLSVWPISPMPSSEACPTTCMRKRAGKLTALSCRRSASVISPQAGDSLLHPRTRRRWCVAASTHYAASKSMTPYRPCGMRLRSWRAWQPSRADESASSPAGRRCAGGAGRIAATRLPFSASRLDDRLRRPGGFARLQRFPPGKTWQTGQPQPPDRASWPYRSRRRRRDVHLLQQEPDWRVSDDPFSCFAVIAGNGQE